MRRPPSGLRFRVYTLRMNPSLSRIRDVIADNTVLFKVNLGRLASNSALHRRHEKIPVAIHDRRVTRVNHHRRIHFLHDGGTFDLIARH